jgi:hypothetical protein
MDEDMQNKNVQTEKIFTSLRLCFYLIFYDVIELMFCRVDWKTILIHKHMFGLVNMIRLNAKNAGLILMQFFVRQNVYENPILILSFFQSFDPYMNEQMPSDCTKDLQLR